MFFYNLLSRHADQLGIWDTALGQNIGAENAETSAPNDIDVCFMHNHGLAMVECKSGEQEQDKSGGMNTLYKTEAVARQQGPFASARSSRPPRETCSTRLAT